ncbi:hypothetical protein TeGR_g12334 [Tetraparma gracilis]|uniref:Tudor domain-containing protein n=1 Tax=Tetraparma gracilis TaxID=2962635 RepID=A0ABQ6MHP5_9STRA|nr:hypothetical protein TeGR_g12334 [Tetraparma gracilis]
MSESAELRAQLADVEALLADDPGNDEFRQLKDDLVELLEITEEDEEPEAPKPAPATATAPAPAPAAPPPAAAAAAAAAPDLAALDSLLPSAAPEKKRPAITSASEFVIPDNLRLAATDTEEAKAKKRKKVKALKQKFNTAKSSSAATEKKASWQSFVAKGKGKRRVPKESMYKTGDSLGVGVGSTSKGTVTDNGKKQKYNY